MIVLPTQFINTAHCPPSARPVNYFGQKMKAQDVGTNRTVDMQWDEV